MRFTTVTQSHLYDFSKLGYVPYQAEANYEALKLTFTPLKLTFETLKVTFAIF